MAPCKNGGQQHSDALCLPGQHTSASVSRSRPCNGAWRPPLISVLDVDEAGSPELTTLSGSAQSSGPIRRRGRCTTAEKPCQVLGRFAKVGGESGRDDYSVSPVSHWPPARVQRAS